MMDEILKRTGQSFDRLCQLINLEKLLPHLRSRITFQNYLEPLETFSTADEKSHKEFILKHLVHNRQEFDEFIKVLLHSGHDEIVMLLEPKMIDLIDLNRCDPRNGFKETFSFGHLSTKDILKKHEEKSASFYSAGGNYEMENSPRGFCLLVNNYFTIGSFKEMQRFRNIFYQLHFDVIMEKNLDAKDLVSRLIQLSQSPQLKDHNAFVFMIITHGNENKEILGFDEQPIKIELLTELFNNENCPLLQNKPRMFFFNCCRGTKTDYGTPDLANSLAHVISTSTKIPSSLPTTEDILVCYSTLDGYLTRIDWDTGTNFGRVLADSFVEKVWYKDLNAVLIRTNSSLRSMARDMQIKHPFEWSQCITKQILFNPNVPHIKEL